MHDGMYFSAFPVWVRAIAKQNQQQHKLKKVRTCAITHDHSGLETCHRGELLGRQVLLRIKKKKTSNRSIPDPERGDLPAFTGFPDYRLPGISLPDAVK